MLINGKSAKNEARPVMQELYNRAHIELGGSEAVDAYSDKVVKLGQ